MLAEDARAATLPHQIKNWMFQVPLSSRKGTVHFYPSSTVWALSFPNQQSPGLIEELLVRRVSSHLCTSTLRTMPLRVAAEVDPFVHKWRS
jgi:hypothetical protein